MPPTAVLRSAAAWLTHPLLPEDFLGLVNPLWSARSLRGVVVSVSPAARGTASVLVRPGRGWRAQRAGQYVRVGVEIGGVRHWRTFSLSSDAGRRDGLVELTAKDVGRVSGHLVHATTPGDVLLLEQAQGDFVLPDRPGPLLMLTAGSGITPVMAMLRTLAATGRLDDLVMLHSAPEPGDVCFADELRALEAEHSGLRLVVRHTRSGGRLEVDELDALCPDWQRREAFVCGPAGLLDAAEQHWAEHAPTAAMHVERFRAALLPGAGGQGGPVTFVRSGTATHAAGGTSLLDAGEAAGATLPSGCRMGICFSCVLPLRAGQVRDLRTGEVHGEQGDLVQTCISAAAGPVELDA